MKSIEGQMSVDGPLVSVVVPSYNHASFIESCLQSIFAQDYTNKQVIVIDDGSTDGSRELLQRLQDDYPFTLRVQANQGLLSTLNRALALADGELFVPIASDDVMLPGRLSRQVEHMRSHPQVAICGGNIVPIAENGERLPHKYRHRPARRLDFRAVFCGTVAGAPAPSMMLRTDVVHSVGGYDETMHIEDLLMMLKVTRAGYFIDVLEDDLAFYRVHDGNTHSRLEFMFDEVLRIYALYADDQDYQAVCIKHFKSYFMKAAKADRGLALKILGRIPLRSMDLKVLRGVLRMLAKS